jgi:hypothetical protein
LGAELDRILRYEMTIQRQLAYAINQLERIQTARKGEHVPAPLNVQLSSDYRFQNSAVSVFLPNEANKSFVINRVLFARWQSSELLTKTRHVSFAAGCFLAVRRKSTKGMDGSEPIARYFRSWRL